MVMFLLRFILFFLGYYFFLVNINKLLLLFFGKFFLGVDYLVFISNFIVVVDVY